MKVQLELKKIEGQRIRRQFFNIPIYFILSFDLAMLCGLTAGCIKDDDFSRWPEIGGFLMAVSAPFLLLLLLLSLVNRFFFGEIICVINDQGLHYHNGFIRWSQINQAVYEPDLPGEIGWRICCCNELHLTVKSFQKETKIVLDHAPLLLLRIIKQHRPGIPCKMSRWGTAVILSLSLGISVVAVLCVLVG